MNRDYCAKWLFSVAAICFFAQACQRAEPVLTGPRAEALKANMTRWGREHVGTGDDTLVDWQIVSARDDQQLTYVEVEPVPKEVGYDKFVFVISFEKEEGSLIAAYCLEKDGYYLFSSSADVWGFPEGPFTWNQFDRLEVGLPAKLLSNSDVQ